MRTSRIKTKLQRGEPALVTTLHLTDPSIFELTSLMGFDGIWMDLEHHTYSLQTAADLMRAARVGNTDIIARPAKGEFMRMQRLLEAGAQGIMYPRCDDAVEAAEVVSWAKFAPLGRRGCDGANGDMPYLTMPIDQYVAEANRQTFIITQIESPAALGRVDEIAAVDGVDILLLGPGDFSILSGIPGRMDDPRILDAKRKIAAAASRAGKDWGCPAGSVQQAEELLEMGARLICYQADIIMIKSGLEQVQREMSPLGFTFDNHVRSP
jgi:4-hydroxy-2-oxoheptanedioate aldolase